MFDFKEVAPRQAITTDYLLDKVGDGAIWLYYYGPFKMNFAYSSKFRRDRNPSTIFYINQKNLITLKDLGENSRLDCFTFVQKLYGLTFKQALYKIAKDFGLTPSGPSIVEENVFKQAQELDRVNKELCLIQFTRAPYTSDNLKYWKFYEITKEDLKKEKIYPVEKLFINHKLIPNPHNYHRYAIIVEWREEDALKTGVKILSPEDKNMKWLSSVPLEVIGDYVNLPYTDEKLLLGKSKKDKVVLSKLFTDVCWTMNERVGAIPDKISREIFDMYKEAYLVWGADEQAVNACRAHNCLGYKYWNTPKEELKYGFNDPAEITKAYGLSYLEQLFKNKGLL